MNESDVWGTLAPGHRADVLIVGGHPASRIADTRKVESVIQAGAVLDRVALRFDAAKDPGFRATVSVTSGAP
jgi:hypothetical protein